MTKAKRTPEKERAPKLTDPERYKRFIDAAKEVGASDDPAEFDRAFDAVASREKPRKATIRRP